MPSDERQLYVLKRTGCAVMRAVSVTASCLCALFLALIVGFILLKGIHNLTPSLLFSRSSEVTVIPALLSTLMMIGMTVAISVPIGVLGAIHLSKYTRKGSRIVKMIRMCLETLSGIPSIVYGLFGMLEFCDLFGMGRSILAACFTLSIMILPTIVRTTEERSVKFRALQYLKDREKIRGGNSLSIFLLKSSKILLSCHDLSNSD